MIGTILSVVAIPLVALGAALWCAIPRSGRTAPAVTLAAAIAGLVLSARLLWALRDGGALTLVRGWVGADALGALLLSLICIVYVTAAIFSAGYLRADGESERRIRIYWANFNLFAFSMLVIPLMDEIGLVWIFVELTTLLSVLLVSFAMSDEALEAAWKYMVLTLLGATIAVLGILILFWALHATGSTDFTWSGLGSAAARMPHALLGAAFVLLLVGYGAKIGLVPLHTWLPDAHSQAPSPVCAMLSGIETSVILYVVLRLRSVFSEDSALHVGTWFVVVGLVSVGTAALLLVQTHDYKRLFAFSTVEHMGVILAAAGMLTPAGDLGAVWQLVAHSVTKSFCFYAAGATLIATGTRDIADVRGLLGSNRLAAAAMLFGGLAIGGAPPFAIFLSELAILRAGLLAHSYLLVGFLALFVVIAFFAVLWHVTNMLGGMPKDEPLRRPVPNACVWALLVAALPVVALGLWLPSQLGHALESAARVLGAV